MADYLILDLKDGPVKIKLRSDLAPNHVARVKELAGQGFYDGVVFHRVIPGFMAQTGDPTGTGSGGSDLPDLKAEFSGEKHKRGTVSAARTANPDSANSQFYICFADAPWLDRQYSAWTISTRSRRAANTITAPSAVRPTRSSKPASKRTPENRGQSRESLAATKSARLPPA
jgi:cyclophilin family peptidyl-prolyl cis-trans isomerase